MPRNANGVYSLPPGNPVVPGTLIESTWANPTMSDIGAELTLSLPRNGSAGMTGPLMLARDGQLNKEAVTFEQLTNAVAGQNSYMPAGAVALFAFNTIPTGWLECNGAAVSRTTYANLFTTIGTTYGPGNGTTTFNVPDLRGQFVRGFDNGKGIDPGRVFGSSQTDSNKAHNHNLVDPGHTHPNSTHNHGIADPGHKHASSQQGLSQSGGGFAFGAGTFGLTTDTSTAPTGISIANGTVVTPSAPTGITLATDGTESRPVNVAMVYCIKAYGALQTDGLGTMAFQNADAVSISGGAGAFTTASVATAPVAPTDVVRLSDLQNASGVSSIISSDPETVTVNNINPNIPVLEINTNTPNGLGKLNGVGQFPMSLIPLTDINYQGPWDASTGQNPSEAFPAVTFNDGDMYQIAIAGTITVFDTTGTPVLVMCDVGSQIIWTTGSQTLPSNGWYYNPVIVPTSLAASSVTFIPSGTILASNAQDAIEELDSETQASLATKAPSSASTAVGTSFTPFGGVAATDVQAAIAELDTDKASLDSPSLTGNPTAPTPPTADDDTSIATTAYVKANIAALSTGNPVGTIIDFSGVVAPSGYLSCPLVPTNISRTTYAALFAAIGTTWGAGDGSTTFGMPYFPANYTGVQADANVGTTTVGEVIAHTHTYLTPAITAVGSSPNNVYATRTADSTGSTGGPANLAAGMRVLKCVKI